MGYNEYPRAITVEWVRGMVEWDGTLVFPITSRLTSLMGFAFSKSSTSDGLDGSRVGNRRLDQVWAGHAPSRPSFLDL